LTSSDIEAKVPDHGALPTVAAATAIHHAAKLLRRGVHKSVRQLEKDIQGEVPAGLADQPVAVMPHGAPGSECAPGHRFTRQERDGDDAKHINDNVASKRRRVREFDAKAAL